MELYPMLSFDSFLYEIFESYDILPRSFLIIDEEVPMSLTHSYSPDTSSLEPCLVDEFACWERLGMSPLTCQVLMSSDEFVVFTETRIFKKTPTRKSWRLFEFAQRLEIGWCVRLVLSSLRRDVEEHIDDEVAFISLEDAFSVVIVHISTTIVNDFSCIEIEHLRFHEEILHLEPEASSISDTGSAHRPRESYPGDQRRYTVALIEFHRECGRELSTLDADVFPSIVIIGFTVSWEAIMYEDAIIFIEGKKTVRPSSDQDDWKSCLSREPIYLWQEECIISSDDIEEVPNSRLCTKRWEKWYRDMFAEKWRCLHRLMIARRGRNASEEEKVD